VRPNGEMTGRERKIVRSFLFGGLGASVVLLWVSVSYLKSWQLAALFAGMMAAGVVFILATPQRNKSASASGHSEHST
jgi:hypothetical protein